MRVTRPVEVFASIVSVRRVLIYVISDFNDIIFSVVRQSSGVEHRDRFRISLYETLNFVRSPLST